MAAGKSRTAQSTAFGKSKPKTGGEINAKNGVTGYLSP